MKKSVLTLTLLSLTMTLLTACGSKSAKAAAATEPTENTEIAEESAEMAPDFELPNLQGSNVKLSSLRGKYVIIDFWGSWCVWCIRGIPQMKAYYTKYKDKLEILGVDCHDTEERWRAAVEENQLPWLQVYCDDANLRSLGALYSVQGFPTKVLVDPKGRIVKASAGEDPTFYTFLDEIFK